MEFGMCSLSAPVSRRLLTLAAPLLFRRNLHLQVLTRKRSLLASTASRFGRRRLSEDAPPAADDDDYDYDADYQAKVLAEPSPLPVPSPELLQRLSEEEKGKLQLIQQEYEVSTKLAVLSDQRTPKSPIFCSIPKMGCLLKPILTSAGSFDRSSGGAGWIEN